MDNNSILTYDYIVIGTGPAGAVMTTILSLNSEDTILVLEAGDNNSDEWPILKTSNDTWRYFPNYFWQGRTISQQYVNKRAFNWTTGRLLGGGSSVNGGQYVRPTNQVLEKWEELLGPMWSPANAQKAFVHLENYNGATTNPKARGYDGPLHIRQAPRVVPTITKKFVDAIELGTGYPVILDYNDPTTPIGPFYRWQLYQFPNGQRESSANAFLFPSIIKHACNYLYGRNFTVSINSTVTKILLDYNLKAKGISYIENGRHNTAYAKKKVILSAGINSSQLLMLSGIGQEEMLSDANIKTFDNNPYVGSNLTNHLLNTATFSVNQMDLEEKMDDENSVYYGGAFLPYPNSQNDERGIQLIGEVSGNLLTVSIINLLPESRGSISIQNNDPLKIVLADDGYLSDQTDLTNIKNVFRNYIVAIANALNSIDTSYKLISPSLDIINDDAALENYIRNNAIGTYHQQSFNRMAPFQNGGVVDNLGNVYGTHDLIVSDSSIIPFTVDGNNSATSYLIGYTLANNIINSTID